MITKIDHISIAVNSIEEAVKFYTDVLGLEVKSIEISEEHKARSALIPVGETIIALVESTDPDGLIAKHIQRKGEGVHHMALGVSNIDGFLETVGEKGVSFTDASYDNNKEAFLQPKQSNVLVELIERGM